MMQMKCPSLFLISTIGVIQSSDSLYIRDLKLKPASIARIYKNNVRQKGVFMLGLIRPVTFIHTVTAISLLLPKFKMEVFLEVL